MNIFYPDFSKDGDQIVHFYGHTFSKEERQSFIKFAQELKEKVPENSKIKVRVQKVQGQYKSDIEVKGLLFGCHILTEAKSFDDLSKKICNAFNEQLLEWRKNLFKLDPLAPYFGGYPSYYKEMVV